jgi:hypothetical protein
MIILSYVAAFSGFIFLSLAMNRHYKKVKLGSAQARPALGKSQRLIFHVTGMVCLLMSSLLCLGDIGIAVGLVQWAGILTLTALQVSLLLTYVPHWLLIFIPTGAPELMDTEFTIPEESGTPTA